MILLKSNLNKALFHLIETWLLRLSCLIFLKLKKDGRSSEPPDSSEDIQDLLEKIYHNHPDSALVCEMLTDLDEGLQEWRYRHVQMVRRTIGTKSGTGGSSGVDYLKGTLMKPLFPDLWTIRNRF